ncbi:hypothetical protein [Streptomyces hygroscopicus]|uniref:hypothetical protein n=1 Tax=Streptomyces hygroscopicus TaxID=1912 RepID=UPI001331480D|nr:hypothetical protein [Streptomyces hygroscopicus]
MLGAQRQELCTLAASAEARDEAVRRAPQALARIRELIGEQCAITRWSPSSLLPVVVLVTGSVHVSDRQAVEDVLLQTWHDSIEIFGTEHALILEHGCETPVDRFVDGWVASMRLPNDAGLVSAPMTADTARHYDQAGPRRPARRAEQGLRHGACRPGRALARVGLHPHRVELPAVEGGGAAKKDFQGLHSGHGRPLHLGPQGVVGGG